MKSIKNLLPALGLVFGATLAMAMNFPTIVDENTPTKVWTPDPTQTETNGYREITDLEIGSDYDCDGTGSNCAVEFENDDPIDGAMNVLEPGVFTEL